MDFTQPWEYGDITFIVEDKKIYANKANLAMSSEVFKAMFSSGFKEKKMTEIPLPDKKFDDVLQLMQLLHPQTLTCVDDSNVHRILPLAHEYQLHALLANCCKALSDGAPSILSLNMADKYSLKLPGLHQKCVEYMTDLRPLSKLQSTPGFKELKPETLIEVLTSNIKKYEELQPEIHRIIHILICSDANHPRDTRYNCPKCKDDRLPEIIKKF